MTILINIIKRELSSYFSTPLAYVFIVIFLAFKGSLTFYVGNFFVRGQADLNAFFAFHPWVYILLIPAVTMRLWAEERKTGTIELLMTLPLTTTQAVLGKFFAAWIFIFIGAGITRYISYEGMMHIREGESSNIFIYDQGGSPRGTEGAGSGVTQGWRMTGSA